MLSILKQRLILVWREIPLILKWFHLAMIGLFFMPVSVADVLYTNIRGYHYIDNEANTDIAAERKTLAPRAGYWDQFEAMLIAENGRISAIFKSASDTADIQKRDTSLRVIDGQGHTVLPGIIDAHGHLLGLGQRLQRVDLVGSTSVEDAQDRLNNYLQSNEGDGWVLGRGWNQVLWPEKVFPKASSLDEIEAQRPVYLKRIDGHAAWLNSAAMKAAGINRHSRDPKGGQIIRTDDGSPTGVLIDKAMDLVEQHIPDPDQASVIEALELAQQELGQMGITSMHDAGVPFPLATIYRKLAEDNQLTVRIYGMISDAEEHLDAVKTPWIGLADDMLNMRSVKLYADGALGSRGAALLAPYSDEPDNSGLLFSPYDELKLKTERAASMGFQVNVHAIGDAGNRQILDIFEGLPKTRHSLRHRVEHAQIVALDDLARFKSLGVIASMQPTHATSDMNMAEDRVGPDRIKGAYAWRRLLDHGTIIAGGSDFPVELSNPFHGLYSAVARQSHDGLPEHGWYPDQAMTRGEALRSFTVDAAFAAHMEQQIGNLQPGQWADFIVIDRDYFAVPANELFGIKVLETWLAGDCIYENESDHDPSSK